MALAPGVEDDDEDDSRHGGRSLIRRVTPGLPLDGDVAVAELLEDVEGLHGPVVARVVGGLGDRRPVGFWQRALTAGWQVAPVALAGAWAFVEAVAIVAPLVVLAASVGIGGDALATLLPAGGDSWLAALAGVSAAGLSDLAGVAVNLPRAIIDLGWRLALAVVPVTGLAVLYGVWLLAWWSRSRAGVAPVAAVERGA